MGSTVPPRTIFKGPDSDTGEEIVVFTRLGRIYAFLRDARTKRFIRRLSRRLSRRCHPTTIQYQTSSQCRR